MGHPIAQREAFINDHGITWKQKLGDENILVRACEYFDDWMTAAGVFMFGYLVWAISQAIGAKEQVFWVTSSWNLNINQVELQQK